MRKNSVIMLILQVKILYEISFEPGDKKYIYLNSENKNIFHFIISFSKQR